MLTRLKFSAERALLLFSSIAERHFSIALRIAKRQIT